MSSPETLFRDAVDELRERGSVYAREAYVFEDDQLPLLVFGALSLLSRGAELELAGTRVCMPRPDGR